MGTAQIGGSVRIGIGPFNTEAHIKTAIEAIGEIVDFQK
jgi:cysteine sulfinate desulfinase/cysteine desulfurase-like protein